MAVHEEFLELCAVAVTGELTEDERKMLDEHLNTCSSCREAFAQYQETATTVVPQLASEMPLPAVPPDSSWSEGKAEAALFRSIESQEQTNAADFFRVNGNGHRGLAYVPPPARWGQFGMLYAAGILLFLALAVCAYRIGEKRGVETATNSGPVQKGDLESAKRELSDAGHDRLVLQAEIANRDKAISELKQQIAKRSGGAEGGAPNPNQQESTNGRGATTASRQDETEASPELAQLRGKLDLEEKQRTDEMKRANSLEAKVAELTQQLQDKNEEVGRQNAAVRDRDSLLEQRDGTIVRQEELLAHDRDIRDLMSARDLYIAEVYDVSKTGETNKPYGRIFYTRGKSLLFYAYDLDQQAGLKKASTFQAWGRREGGQDLPVSLGVLYEDSVANKRWVVKSEDPKTLEQIDAVFVTIEPNGGSRRPSSKPLLFASLRIHPNHP